MSGGASSCASSEFNSDDDLDDIPLFIPQSTNKAPARPMLAFSSLSIASAQQQQQQLLQRQSERSPLPSERLGMHGGSLTTPDPGEPLPTSRTSRRSVVTPLRLPSEPPGNHQQQQQQQQGPAVPNIAARSIPKLNLGLAPAADTAPLTRRGAREVPEATPHSALQHTDNTMPAAPATAAPTPLLPAAGQQAMQVSLLSTAFDITQEDINKANGCPPLGLTAATRQFVTQRFVTALQVGPERIRVFQVAEWLPHAEPVFGPAQTGHLHVAVQIDGNTFSLGSMEALIQESNDMRAIAKTSSDSVASLLQDKAKFDQQTEEIKHLHEERTELLITCARQVEQLKSAAAEVARMEQENAMLKAALQRSDEQRQQLQGTIKGLRSEFDVILREQGMATKLTPKPAA